MSYRIYFKHGSGRSVWESEGDSHAASRLSRQEPLDLDSQDVVVADVAPPEILVVMVGLMLPYQVLGHMLLRRSLF
jgi:hypothetical protein